MQCDDFAKLRLNFLILSQNCDWIFSLISSFAIEGKVTVSVILWSIVRTTLRDLHCLNCSSQAITNSSQSTRGHFVTLVEVSEHLISCKPGARSSKFQKLFGRISGNRILFVSSKRRRLEARNFAVILIFIPLTIYEKTSFTE